MSLAQRIIAPVSPVDRLGAIRAQLAGLQAQADVLSDEIKAYGPGIYEGALFSATVSEIAGRESIDAKAMEARLIELGVDGRWFSKHTKIGKASVRLSVTDR